MILEFHWGNETIFLRNETICLNYFLYICGMKGHSACRDKGLASEETALHDGGIPDDGEMGIIASLWLGKDELTN